MQWVNLGWFLEIHMFNIVTPSLTCSGLTHWGRVTHICVGKLTIIDSDNGLSPGRRQAIIWTSAEILLIGPLGTNSSQIVIGIQNISFKKIHLKVSSAKWHPFGLGFNVFIQDNMWRIKRRHGGNSQDFSGKSNLIPQLVSHNLHQRSEHNGPVISWVKNTLIFICWIVFKKHGYIAAFHIFWELNTTGSRNSSSRKYPMFAWSISCLLVAQWRKVCPKYFTSWFEHWDTKQNWKRHLQIHFHRIKTCYKGSINSKP